MLTAAITLHCAAETTHWVPQTAADRQTDRQTDRQGWRDGGMDGWSLEELILVVSWKRSGDSAVSTLAED